MNLERDELRSECDKTEKYWRNNTFEKEFGDEIDRLRSIMEKEKVESFQKLARHGQKITLTRK